MPGSLVIDDDRDLGADLIARNYDYGIMALKLHKWDTLWLDGDLNDPDRSKDGMGILCWLEKNPEHMPKEIQVISSHPVRREQMQLKLKEMKERGLL